MTRKIERTCRSPSYSQLCKARQRAEELYKSLVVSRSDGLRLAAFRRKVLHGLDHIHQKGNTMKMDGNLDVKRIKGEGEAAEDADEHTNSKTAAEAFDPCTHGQAGGVESLTHALCRYPRKDSVSKNLGNKTTLLIFIVESLSTRQSCLQLVHLPQSPPL